MSAVLPPAQDKQKLKVLSPDEVRERLTALSEAELGRLEDYGTALVRALPALSERDLLGDAYLRLLSGQRKHPAHLPTFAVLYGAMKSIANAGLRKAKGAVDWNTSIDDDDGEELLTLVRDDAAGNPENAAIAQDLLERLDERLGDDENARLVLEAWADGLRNKEAAEAAGLSFKDYEAARKRIIRRLDALQTQGSTK